MDRIYRLIEEMEDYAHKNNVPIMSKDSIETIQKIIKENNIHSILEIGSAIGYSSICMKMVDTVNNITTIERDDERYNIAVENIKNSCLENINIIHDDALNTIINDKFDLVIIDAAKSQNTKFFNKYKENLNSHGIIIIDNLEFHGYVGKSSEIKSRNLRQMVRKIENFLVFLDNLEDYDVEYIEVGDKLGVCRWKK